ncbi:MAG: hypothetical protein AAF211_07885 [Myxococcota bacterium]
MTVKAFAESEGLNPRTLGWWRWRIRQANEPDETPVTFTEVTVGPEDEPTVVIALEHIEAHIVVDRSTNLPLLRDVLEALS